MLYSRFVLLPGLLIVGLLAGCDNSANVGNSPDAGASGEDSSQRETSADAPTEGRLGPLCGDGVVEPPEKCDTKVAAGQPGACPTTCDDKIACTKDTLLNGGTCTAVCSNAPITQCVGGDGCCPAGCTFPTDSDCSTTCGNGTVEPSEKCDTKIAAGKPGACPTTCDDKVACTKDTLLNGGTCGAVCSNTSITQCISGDGCCPTGCDNATDSDCPKVSGAKAGCTWFGSDRYPSTARTFPSGGPFVAGSYSVIGGFGSYSLELWISNNGPTGQFFSGEKHLAFSGSFKELDVSGGTVLASDGSSLVAISQTQFWKVGGVVNPVTFAVGPGDALYFVSTSGGNAILTRRLNVSKPGSTLDSSFGQGGSVTLTVPSNAATQGMGPAMEVKRIFVDGGGNLYLVATTVKSATKTKHPVVIRYLSTGVVDTSFAAGAYALSYDITGVESAMDMNRQHLFLFAHLVSAYPSNIVVHLTPTGADASYGTGGLASAPVCYWPSLGPASDGRLVIATSCGNELQVLRLQADGSQDMTYAGTGLQKFPVTMFSKADEIRLVGVAMNSSNEPSIVFNGAEKSVYDHVDGVMCKLTP